MRTENEKMQETSLKLMNFLFSVILILILFGFAFRYMMATVDDALGVSAETVSQSFSQRNQVVHAYWINNGRKDMQYMDIAGVGGKTSRYAYTMSYEGWPTDVRVISGEVKLDGATPCVRLTEAVAPEISDGRAEKLRDYIITSNEGCTINTKDSKLFYSFRTGEISISER